MLKRIHIVTIAALLIAHLPLASALSPGDTAPAVVSPQWLNSAPLTPEALTDKVVLVEFWTFGCWNCRNVEPYVKRWHQQFKDQGFVVIGVHTPEFDREKEIGNVSAYLKKNDITWPVAIDNDFANWNRYGNRYWPAFYLRDRKGTVRYVHFGEGRYNETKAMIARLLDER
jgi:thiol-disulfide isomerase/thioredoxin